MKTYLVFAVVLLVAVATFAQSNELSQNDEVVEIFPNEPVHMLQKRQLNRLPSCQLWECSSNCRRRGFKGGYCAYTGCSCY
ncbi:defense protein 6-like [Melitaea cinxia]|uniref:defense protein 6-like n=1 Tax=Melitaea cinxia TaxID=113334 RepID=UPI001E27186B|nr:defense protein 6-like [Melitaea cinxia]